jgi:hypothetical protein
MKPKLIEVQLPFGTTLRVNRHARPSDQRKWGCRAWFCSSPNPRILGHVRYMEHDHASLIHEIVHAAFEAVRSGAVLNGDLEESVATATGLIYEAASKEPELWK